MACLRFLKPSTPYSLFPCNQGHSRHGGLGGGHPSLEAAFCPGVGHGRSMGNWGGQKKGGKVFFGGHMKRELEV